jgi:cation diffusion facilitator family transporter
MPASDIHDLYRLGRRASLLGCATGVLLGVTKLIAGLWGNSVALVADGIHSFGDALLSGVVWGALRYSQQPADSEHPYGHTRAEAVAGSSVSLIVVLSAFFAGWESAHGFFEPDPPNPSGFTLLVAAASFLVNEALHRYSRAIARRMSSLSLHAAAWDYRMNSLTALAIFVALALTQIGGPVWHAADHVAGLLVALVILVAGVRLFFESLHELMDAQAPPHLVEAVRKSALSVEGVRGVEKLLMRKTGLEYLVDIHVEVDPAATVTEGHAIGHAVKDQVMSQINFVKDVLVHIEPAPAVSANRAP